MNRDVRAIIQLKKYAETINVLTICLVVTIMLLLAFIFSKTEPMDPEATRLMLLAGTGGTYVGLNAFFKVFFIADEVPKGLSFGMTRKKLFIGLRIVDALELLVVTLLTLVLVKEIDAFVVFKVTVFLFGLIMWIEGIAGNNVVRYGKIVFWIYYIVFMLAFIGIPRILHMVSAGSAPFMLVVDFFLNPFFNQGIVWLILVAFSLAGLLVNWITFRKIPVNYTI